MARNQQKYAVTLQLFVNTDGNIMAVSANTFEAVCNNRGEASIILAMAYADAARVISQFEGFDVTGIPTDMSASEVHIVMSIAGQVVAKFDAVPVKAQQVRQPNADSFMVAGSAALN